MTLFKRMNIGLLTLMMTLPLFAQAAKSEHYKQSKTNKAEDIVVQFYEKTFNQRLDVETMANEYLSENYIQHNPYVPTGKQGFIDGLGAWLASVPATQKWNIKKVISDGNLVVLHIHMVDEASGELGTALVDIFRVKRGKIVEHWDVSQAIPDWMAHDNGMF